MTFKPLAIQVLMSRVSSANNSDKAASALDALAGSNRGFDLAEIVKQFKKSRGGVSAKAKSWLGDGENEAISAAEVEGTLGSAKVAAFAASLGVDRKAASESLAIVLPELIDKSSQGGYLVNSIGSKGVFAGFASRLLKKSA